MKIIKPWIKIDTIDGIYVMKNLERSAKQCYRTTGNITETSYKNFLKNCINRGHESVLEHEKITIRMCCDIGVYKDLTRHRFGSFSIESTRYCNYSKDRFDNQIRFIQPLYFDDAEKAQHWVAIMTEIEKTYMKMAEIGCTPDEMRMILPHSTAAELVMTANIREWRHILRLRAQKEAHPTVQQLMIPLLLKFKELMPELFDDIPYNKDFDKEKYASVIMLIPDCLSELIVNIPDNPDELLKNMEYNNVIQNNTVSTSYTNHVELKSTDNYTNHVELKSTDNYTDHTILDN